jgi:hypothetical protein
MVRAPASTLWSLRPVQLAGVLCTLIACSRRPAPVEPSERALFRDLERQVTVSATTGWGIDRIELEGMLETTLESVCRVDPLARRG